jgi:hypothetical protein
MREASSRILLRPAARLYDAVERDVDNGDDLSHGDFSFTGWPGFHSGANCAAAVAKTFSLTQAMSVRLSSVRQLVGLRLVSGPTA